MSTRRTIAALALGALVATAAVQPAHADHDSGGTVTTFSVTTGFLDITVPAGSVESPVALAGSVGGSAATGHLGSTAVTDNRNSSLGWTVSASSTAFTRDGGTETIPAGAVNITIAGTDVASATIGGLAAGSLFLPDGDGTDGATGGAIGATLAGANLTTLVGTLPLGLFPTFNNAVTYDPTITVTIPVDTPAGDYTGTITQTVH